MHSLHTDLINRRTSIGAKRRTLVEILEKDAQTNSDFLSREYLQGVHDATCQESLFLDLWIHNLRATLGWKA